MNKPKKPAVVVKTAPKKRGRPVGSKNKLKFDGQARVKAAAALAALGGKDKVDWETLAKRLQGALAIEMKTTESLENLFEEFKAKVVIAERMSFLGRLKFLFTGKL